jgi:aryl-alcohol dehydrogenase-like predicted oxidoreductase
MTIVSRVEQYWPTRAELKSEGTVRAIGLSNHNISQVEHAEKIAHVDSVQPQPPLSIINRSQADQIARVRTQWHSSDRLLPTHSGLLTVVIVGTVCGEAPADTDVPSQSEPGTEEGLIVDRRQRPRRLPASTGGLWP